MDGSAPQLFIEQPDGAFSILLVDKPGNHQTIPLGFQPGQQGTFEMRAKGMASLSNNVYLYDLLTDNQQDLKADPYYLFEAAPGDPHMRFEIRIKDADDDLTGSEGQMNQPQKPLIYTQGKTLVLEQLQYDNNYTLHIFDTGGRLLHYETIQGSSTRIDLPFPAGLYLIRLQEATELHRKRVIIH